MNCCFVWFVMYLEGCFTKFIPEIIFLDLPELTAVSAHARKDGKEPTVRVLNVPTIVPGLASACYSEASHAFACARRVLPAPIAVSRFRAREIARATECACVPNASARTAEPAWTAARRLRNGPHANKIATDMAVARMACAWNAMQDGKENSARIQRW
jgi:hypothetical protein